LATIFVKNTDILKKKKVLFVVGKSNTLKTTLIVNTMTNYFGMENIALMTKSSNFPFQNFENKTIGILDEFVYNEYLHEEYLKLFEGRQIIIEKKFKDPVIIEPINIIIISNENFLEKNIDEDKKHALENRLNTIFFSKSSFAFFEENINDKLKKEEIEIVIFIVKVYFEHLCNYKLKKNITYLENQINSNSQKFLI
jgi:hypothetical protein